MVTESCEKSILIFRLGRFHWDLKRAQPPAGHVPDGEIEVFLSFVEVDLLIERNEHIGVQSQLVLVYVKGEAIGEMRFRKALVVKAKTATPRSISALPSTVLGVNALTGTE